MINRKVALVVPNNRLIKCWKSYVENFKAFMAKADICLFVVDDYSPDVESNKLILQQEGIPFEYYTIKKQLEFFSENFGSESEKYWSVIPHRTDACRSFGYLVAGIWGADLIITFDDDNYPLTSLEPVNDYIGNHDIVNSTFSGSEVTSSNGWFNTIDLLAMNPERRIFARGFPYAKRSSEIDYYYKNACREVVMNIGLWTINPDVDALTVLNEGSLNGLPVTKSMHLTGPEHLILAEGTFAPLNTANTAYSRKLLPIIYDTFQGAEVGELKLDRFGDIWCHLFVKKILDCMGTRVAMGAPLVEHRREQRNTFVDFQKEFWGILITEKLFTFIEQTQLTAKTYVDLYLELQLKIAKDFKGQIQQESIRKYLDRLCNSMALWIEILEKLNLN